MATVNLLGTAGARTDGVERTGFLAGVSPVIIAVGVIGWGGVAVRLVASLV
jgi:hypothetical protein